MKEEEIRNEKEKKKWGGGGGKSPDLDLNPEFPALQICALTKAPLSASIVLFPWKKPMINF